MMIAKFSPSRLIRSRAGFSLIEVLVAIGIFSFAMLGLAIGAITITRANKTSQFHTVATNMAQDSLEQLRAMPFANVNNCASNCDATPPTYQGVVYTRTWTVNPNTVTFKQINVTVAWTDTAARTLTVSAAMSPNTL
jgi:prepilin-type N-terminal cleavage/methylation domain-containing protein